MQKLQLAEILKIEAFENVPENQLQWFINESLYKKFEEGSYLFKPGDFLWGTHIIIKGSLEIYILNNNQKTLITTITNCAITGILPFSRAQKATGFGCFLEDSLVLSFPKEKIKEMINLHYELTQALVHVMTSRVRDFTASQQQNEKMMALGKLSAGLAHELNNPASAIVRGSQSLKKHLKLQPDTFKKVISIKIDADAVDAINEKLYKAISEKEINTLSMMQKAAKEEEIEVWLLNNSFIDTYDIPENFVEFNINTSDLEYFKNLIPEHNLEPIFIWINNNLVTERMVDDMQEASKRIAHLIGSVKNFTHMDAGSDRQFANIHTGIINTLVMLNHKIKKHNIKVIENYDRNIPDVKIFVGELNQVWTNIIDNALDALVQTENPILTINSKQEKGFIKVNIIDNGSGIPEEIKTRIFDPFFTTKEIGKGTGLGLDVVSRIIKQHNGSVKVNSTPRETNFEICFPIEK